MARVNFPLPNDAFWGCKGVVDGEEKDSLVKALNQLNGEVYNNASRPDASTIQEGSMIWNSDDKAPNFSDGTNWRDAVGNLT
jgi:hypothetical protein